MKIAFSIISLILLLNLNSLPAFGLATEGKITTKVLKLEKESVILDMGGGRRIKIKRSDLPSPKVKVNDTVVLRFDENNIEQFQKIFEQVQKGS